MKKLTLLSLALLAAATAWFWPNADDNMQSSAHTEQLALGQQLYADNCASCHGVKLEGQPNWKTQTVNGRLPAPPHDASGHTWHHADEQLFAIIKFGTAAIVGNGYQSDMLGFGDLLSDVEIRAVLDFIKSTWPERERAYQRQVSGL